MNFGLKKLLALNKYSVAMLFVALIIIIIVIAICRNKEPSLTIGAILPLSGSASFSGNEVKDGMQLAVDEINRWGGINGREVNLIVEDSNSDPETGKAAFKKLEAVYSPLFYISVLSNVSMNLSHLAESNKCVLVGLVVTNENFPGENSYVFRYYPTAENDIAAIIPVFRRLKIQKLGVLYIDNPFGNSIYYQLQKRSHQAGYDVTGATFSAETNDFSSYFDRLIDQDAIYVVGYVRQMKIIFDYLTKHPLSKPFFSNNVATIPSLIGLPGAQGTYVSAPIIYKKNFKPSRKLRDKYEGIYDKPFNHYAANGYDFIKLVSRLLQGQPLSRETVRQLLESGFIYSGVFGLINLRRGAHDTSFPLYPARIESGNIIYVQ